MFARISFVTIAVFWVTMNVLLWRAEYGPGRTSGNPMPIPTVWKKILTAPDSSNLTIRYHGKTVGFCLWSTAVSEELANMEEAPSGSETLRKYRVRLDGNIDLPGTKESLRFECTVKLASQTNWDEFTLRLRSQSLTAFVHSRAAEQTVRVSVTNGPASMERVLSFNDVQHPEILLSTLVGPLVSGLRENLELPPLQTSRSKLDAVQWQAWADTLYVSHQPLQVYRINGQIAGLFDVILHVSPVGEIFKVQLPDSIVLLHDRLINY